MPAGSGGAYTLVLTGLADGPFTVRVAARYAGFSVHRQEIKGTIGAGERVFTRINQSVKGQDPRTARVHDITVEALQAWNGAEPPAVLASPRVPRRPVN